MGREKYIKRSVKGLEGLIEIVNDIIDVLRADGQANRRRRDARSGEFLLVHLGVRRRSRMDDERLDIRDIGQQAEDLEMVDELLGRLSAALDLEREDGDTAVREVLLVELVVRMIRQSRMVDLRDMRVLGEVVDDLEGVLDMALDAQRQRLRALQQQERIERRERCALIAQDQRADVRSEGRCADILGKADAVVARVRVNELWELARSDPVELAAIDEDTAERRAVTADELRGRMDDDVGAVLERTQLIRRRERTVDDERDLVLVRDIGDSLDVDEVGVRVADRLDVDGTRILLDGLLEDLDALRRIDERRLDAVVRERVLKEVVGAAVDRRSCDDVLAVMDECLERLRDSSCTRCDSNGSDAAFECGDTLGEDILRRVRQAAVDVAGILQCKAVSSVLRVVEHEGRRLVDRYSARVRGGISLLLTNMQLQCLKMVLSLFTHE